MTEGREGEATRPKENRWRRHSRKLALKPSFDPAIHPAKRLRIMSIVCAAKQVEFGFIRDQLEVSDSDLSKQLKALGGIDYVAVERVDDRRGGTTWVSATEIGAERFQQHCAALREIVDSADLDGKL